MTNYLAPKKFSMRLYSIWAVVPSRWKNP